MAAVARRAAASMEDDGSGRAPRAARAAEARPRVALEGAPAAPRTERADERRGRAARARAAPPLGPDGAAPPPAKSPAPRAKARRRDALEFAAASCWLVGFHYYASRRARRGGHRGHGRLRGLARAVGARARGLLVGLHGTSFFFFLSGFVSRSRGSTRARPTTASRRRFVVERLSTTYLLYLLGLLAEVVYSAHAFWPTTTRRARVREAPHDDAGVVAGPGRDVLDAAGRHVVRRARVLLAHLQRVVRALRGAAHAAWPLLAAMGALVTVARRAAPRLAHGRAGQGGAATSTSTIPLAYVHVLGGHGARAAARARRGRRARPGRGVGAHGHVAMARSRARPTATATAAATAAAAAAAAAAATAAAAAAAAARARAASFWRARSARRPAGRVRPTRCGGAARLGKAGRCRGACARRGARRSCCASASRSAGRRSATRRGRPHRLGAARGAVRRFFWTDSEPWEFSRTRRGRRCTRARSSPSTRRSRGARARGGVARARVRAAARRLPRPRYAQYIFQFLVFDVVIQAYAEARAASAATTAGRHAYRRLALAARCRSRCSRPRASRPSSSASRARCSSGGSPPTLTGARASGPTPARALPRLGQAEARRRDDDDDDDAFGDESLAVGGGGAAAAAAATTGVERRRAARECAAALPEETPPRRARPRARVLVDAEAAGRCCRPPRAARALARGEQAARVRAQVDFVPFAVGSASEAAASRELADFEAGPNGKLTRRWGGGRGGGAGALSALGFLRRVWWGVARAREPRPSRLGCCSYAPPPARMGRSRSSRAERAKKGAAVAAAAATALARRRALGPSSGVAPRATARDSRTPLPARETRARVARRRGARRGARPRARPRVRAARAEPRPAALARRRHDVTTRGERAARYRIEPGTHVKTP